MWADPDASFTTTKRKRDGQQIGFIEPPDTELFVNVYTDDPLSSLDSLAAASAGLLTVSAPLNAQPDPFGNALPGFDSLRCSSAFDGSTFQPRPALSYGFSTASPPLRTPSHPIVYHVESSSSNRVFIPHDFLPKDVVITDRPPALPPSLIPKTALSTMMADPFVDVASMPKRSVLTRMTERSSDPTFLICQYHAKPESKIAPLIARRSERLVMRHYLLNTVHVIMAFECPRNPWNPWVALHAPLCFQLAAK